MCNILGDWFLIFPMSWGVKGAAIATDISQTLGMFAMLIHFIHKKGNLRFGKVKLETGIIKEILIRGLPEGISQLSTPVMSFCMNIVLINKVGDLGVNAFSVITYVASFSMTVFFGASSGLQPLLGRSYGAGKERDLKFYFRTGLKISFFGSLIVTIFVVLFSRYICVLFGTDSATQSYILKVLLQFAAGFVVMAANSYDFGLPLFYGALFTDYWHQCFAEHCCKFGGNIDLAANFWRRRYLVFIADL